MSWPCRSLPSGSGSLRHALGLGDGLVDIADHVEGGLGQMVELAGDDALEAGDRLLQRHLAAREAGEDLRDVERLAGETLALPCTGDGQLVPPGEFIHGASA